ncbi:neurogenic locus notch homolog protein 1-like [Haliotis rubra]|uniref:neurogenic locus notch homolog protein 1-like n=1 Tax=Haliotis rubra TaxID=36100 RepID=UPI001EE5C529|nr:neurogenic locus notch homolog protein 1-like [Haliotis rubra]
MFSCIWYIFVLLMLPAAWSQRASTWDACGCSWVAWQEWAKCSKLCYGRQVRERQVRVLDSCGTFRHCDGGAGAYDYRDCNTHCTFGSYDSSYGGCRCPAGRYGTCCDNVVTCGTPQTTSNGAYTVSDSYDYGSVATYTCSDGYNMTGSATMTCSTYGSYSTYGYWTGSTPRCLFAESCNSNPCQNAGTCVNGLDLFTCMCPPGWSGVNCEEDVQPPVMSGCENRTDLNTADHELTHEWTVPTFTDPLGNEVTTTSNYISNSSRFPWGDFFVQYVATKANNGLQKECKFQLSIRPFPCDNLSVPEFGYVACNGWRPDFGQYCLIGCLANRTLPRDIDGSQWYACGAGGTWSSNPGMIQCEDKADLIGASGGILGSPDSCDDVSAVKEQYISSLKNSDFNTACLKHTDLCVPGNVNIRC